MVDIADQVNALGQKAKLNQLQPDDIQGGTFTMSNTGIFGSLMGTPIINQPQVAILALGEILKKPAVIETSEGDVVAVRKKMFLSLSYDHRIIDGALGARF
ncbi:MAG: 2-oxo acid dehydrogenase subunit E2 [Bacteroidetes bacterium]|nr:2-oxo acid dehydrogenase subunit E2 [Bacteroidota bacterium]